MSHPSRPRAHGPAQRRRRSHRIEAIEALEERKLLIASLTSAVLPLAGNGPVVTSGLNALTPTSFTLTPPPIPPGGAITNADLGTITYNTPTLAAASTIPSAAPFTSVSQLAPASEFGGDIVRVVAGPGGVFGDGVYAISRGAGDNTGAVDRPGVIYRVDPATGKATVFFDLNSVISQLEPGTNPYGTGTNAPAANSLGNSTGLVNWYDIAFDPEGTFDGKPSMFVSSVDRSDPNKNVIYRIAPDGTFMGAFVQYTAGQSSQKFVINPTAIVVPPPEQQQFLHGLIAGSGGNATLSPGGGIPPTTVPTGTTAVTTGTVEIPAPGTFSALYFDSTQYSPGQQITSSSTGAVQFPTGVSSTQLDLGPQVGLTAANPDYISSEYSAFTDFGSPTAGGIPGEPGASGVEGLAGDLIIGNTVLTNVTTGTFAGISPTIQTILPADSAPALNTDFRRFEDIAFDQFGYFSQAVNVNYAAVTTTNGQPTLATGTGTTTPVSNAGNLFVSDLATGATIQITPVKAPTIPGQPAVATPVAITVPIDTVGGLVSATYDYTTGVYTVSVTGGVALGGRIIRVTPTGQVTTFASGFDTNPNQDSSSFIGSELSISFSADGTILYASDDQGIWQFKTTASLASSTSGSLLGLNDLRSLGVPYDGQGAAVAVIDSGVDGSVSNFRGRVATGTNVLTNGNGNTDTASLSTTTGAANNTGGNNNATTGFAATSLLGEGHGTLIAGIVAQFVPQATIEPVNVFYPFQTLSTANTTTTTGTGATGVSTTPATNGTATVNTVYDGLAYVAKHPFVNDPIRPGQTARVIDSVIGFGTTDTYASEGTAYKQYPQIVVAFKNQLKKFRSLGIAPIAATGQFGSPLNSSFAANVNGAVGGGGTAGGTVTNQRGAENNSQNTTVGDVNGVSLPAVLNEVISVTGTYSFPFSTGPNQAPTDPSTAVSGDVGASVPILIAGPGIVVGGQSTGTTTPTTTTTLSSPISQLTAADSRYFSDQLLGSNNRNVTTDYAAPAINLPTFRRRLLVTTTTTGGTTAQSGISTDFNDHNTFVEGGTSLSAAVVGGAYSMISSALNYWTQLNLTGVTSDAYLTQPVGALTLNFGKNGLKDLSVYNNPDGINAIMAWTSVPVTDANNGLSASGPLYRIGSTGFRQYARLSISDAIYSIQGTEAIQYLTAHNDWQYIDANNDGKVTAQELQNFEDNSAKTGMAEAGAMARLLGGTARIGTDITQGQPVATTNGGANTIASSADAPEQPDVLQREFNYFDYAADGQLNGFITIPQFQMLGHTLLPNPTAYTITDRQRASANGFLLDPGAVRNFHDLQHISPKFEFVPKSALVRYRNISPAQFKVNRLSVFNTPGSQGPFFSLYTGGSTATGVQETSPGQSSTAGQSSNSTTTQQPVTSTPAPTPPTAPVAATPTTTGSPATTTPTTTPTPTAATTPTPTPTSTAATTPTSTGSADSPAAVAQANLAQANSVLQGVLGSSPTSGSANTSTPAVGAATTAGTLTPLTTGTNTVTVTPAPVASAATTPTPTPTSTATKITPKVSKLLTTPAKATTTHAGTSSSNSTNNLGKKIVNNLKSLWKDIKG